MKTRFLHCTLDTEAHSLTRDGAAVHLTPKAFEVLALLVSHRPRVIAKSELLESVWPATFVTDASLARTIHEIRTAIGDQKAGGAIRTIHGRGYAFAAEAHDESAGAGPPQAAAQAPQAWLIAGLHVFPLAVGTHVAGRDPAAAIPLDSALASWHHARFEVGAAAFTVTDLESKNGTYVNGRREAAATCLKDGDSIQLGSTTLVFRAGDRPIETITADPEDESR